MFGSPPWGQTGAKASGRSAARQGGACATLTSRSAAAAAARVGGGSNNPRSDHYILRGTRCLAAQKLGSYHSAPRGGGGGEL